MPVPYFAVLILIFGVHHLMASDATNPALPEESAQALGTDAIQKLIACEDYGELSALPAIWRKRQRSVARSA